MTTEARRALSHVTVGGVLGMLLFSCAGTSKTRHGDSIDVSGYPPPIQAAYRVFAQRCSRCHTLARPLNARIDDEQHWVRYVTRMRRNPTSGINRENAEVILRFLLFYTAERTRPQAPAPMPTNPSTGGTHG